MLLHQIFASLRQGKLLAETIADFWSPHEPIHERARNALPHVRRRGHRAAAGVAALGPVADQGATGPTAVDPGNDRSVDHPGPDPSSARSARARAGDRRRRARPPAGRGGGARAGRARQRSQRIGAAERGRSAGRSSAARPGSAGPQRGLGRRRSLQGRGFGWLFGWKKRGTPAPPRDPVELAVARWSRPWPTTRRRCGPRPPWHWAGSGRPRRRSPPS